MKKVIFVLVFTITLCLTGCQNFAYYGDNTSIISLPTSNTANTANGYRNPDFDATSSKAQSTSSKLANSTTSPTLSERFIASKNSKIFHRLDCSTAKRIKEENIIIFDEYEEASTDGYLPCNICLKEE